jgi:ATP-dependent protease ClpP protease subunit
MGPLILNIDSIGGDHLLGVRCYQELRRHRGGSIARVLGAAESAAALICMGADRVEIAPHGHLMIHNPRGMETEHNLEYLTNQQAEIYAARTGIAKPIIVKWLERERRMSAAEAVRLRFADALLERVQQAC